MDTSRINLIVNFGGPRTLCEIEQFLISLLNDQDVIRTSFPAWIHRLIFTRVAKKRAVKIQEDYEGIGGGSPIYEDTEKVASALRETLQEPVLTFHRYLPKTHAPFLAEIEKFRDVKEIRVFPMFPQFSYATTGSIARFFSSHVSKQIVDKMRWIQSYATHPSYIASQISCIQQFLKENHLGPEETILFFSAHGLPKKFVETGDPYKAECEAGFQHISAAFPSCLNYLSYQSQFGKQEWIQPYTAKSCEEIGIWGQGRSHVVFIPLSFTSDHIETLFEIEQLYLPVCKEKGFNALRAPALNHRADWYLAIQEILKTKDLLSNEKLILPKKGFDLKKSLFRNFFSGAQGS